MLALQVYTLTQARRAMHPDFRLMLEILGLVAAGIVAVLAYTIDAFFVHEIAQGLLQGAIAVLMAECWFLIRKNAMSKRPRPLSKWVVAFLVVHLIVVPALVFFIYVIFVADAVIGDSVLVGREPSLIVWIVVGYALLRADILAVKQAKLFIQRLRASYGRQAPAEAE